MIEIGRDELLPALKTLKKVTATWQNTVGDKILRNLKFQASNNQLKLSARDFDVQITISLSCKTGDESIETTANVCVLEKFVRTVPKKEIVCFNYDGSSMFVISGQNNMAIPTLPAKDMRLLNHTTIWPWTFVIGGDALERINRKLFSVISTDELRFYLNGIYWHVDQENPKKLVSVSIDNARLAHVVTDVNTSIANLPPIIIPRRFWQLVNGFFDGDEQVVIFVSDTKIRARQKGKEIISKLIDAEYPDYKQKVPQLNGSEFVVKRKELLSTIKDVSVVFSHVFLQNKYFPIDFSFGKKTLKLHARDKSSGETSKEIDVIRGNTADAMGIIETGFNGKILSEILTVCEADEVAFKINAKSPRDVVLIEEEGKEDVFFLIMPIIPKVEK